MAGVNISLQISSGGDSTKVAISTASAQSAALLATSYLITPDVNCFARTGANPTAVADGTDILLLANNQYRVVPLVIGQKLAFITPTGTGNVYLTPNA